MPISGKSLQLRHFCHQLVCTRVLQYSQKSFNYTVMSTWHTEPFGKLQHLTVWFSSLTSILFET